MQYWLIKSEGDCYSIDDLKRDKKIAWDGVRNFQARNYMMQDMKLGDLALFYHSNGNPSGIVGVAKVASKSHPDLSALNPKDEHFDPRASKEKPVWHCVDFRFVTKFKNVLSLEELKTNKLYSDMLVARKGNRLSITPVSEIHFKRVLRVLS